MGCEVLITWQLGARSRRGVHTSTRQLEADVRSFIERHNENPRPYKWVKIRRRILSSVKRFCQKAGQTLCGRKSRFT